MVQTDIVILTASFGNGHHTAMETIASALLTQYQDIRIHKIDIYDIATPRLKKPLSQTYNYLTRTTVPIYNPLYSLRNGRRIRVDDLLVALYFKRFQSLMSECLPKIIISVFPTGAEFAAHYKKIVDPSVLLSTVITDVVAAWEWIHPETDWYAVPTPEIKDTLIGKGIQEASIYVTGVPVIGNVSMKDPSITTDADVLFICTAMGRVSFSQVLIDYMAKSPAVFEVVTGRNKALFEQLTRMTLPSNIHVRGYVENLHQRMASVSLVVSKPGGATLFEAIASGVPLLAYESNIKQEQYNSDFIKRWDIGATFKTEEELMHGMQWLLGDASARARMKANMHLIQMQLDLDAFIEDLIAYIKKGPSTLNTVTIKAKKPKLLMTIKGKGKHRVNKERIVP